MNKIVFLFIFLCNLAVGAEWQLPKSLYAPARYAFVADKGTPHIAVVDLEEGKQIDLLKLPSKVEIFAMSTDDGYLAFADRNKARLFIYNAKNRQWSHVDLPSYVYQLMFIPGEEEIAIRLAQQVGVINYKTAKLSLLPKIFPAPNVDPKHETLFTMIFDVVGRTFWILNKSSPILEHYSYRDPVWRQERLGNFEGYATGVPAPDGAFIALNSYQWRSGEKKYPREGIVFFPASGKVLTTGKMYSGETLDNPMILPYVDNASRRVYFADRGGNLAVFDLWKHDELRRKTLGFSPTVMRTGWLDKKLIIGGYQNMVIYDATTLDKIDQFDLPEEVNDIWVTGDSKTALFTMEYYPLLMRYDLQNNRRLPDIRLDGIAEANLIRMGSTNTLCY